MANNMNVDESLESLLNKATNPLNRNDDWEYIMEFCDRVNAELEGFQIAIKLLLHKIKSPQPKEAIQALTVLEACVKNCGEQFHNKLGNHEVIDELTNLVLNINYGKPCDENVKEKLIALLYAWSIALPDQLNIKSAYGKLKIKGCITKDPDVDVSSFIASTTKSKTDHYFSDKEKKEQLEKLLKSKNKTDLQAANLLIQSAVQADELKMEKSRKRLAILEEVNNNVKLLQDMLGHYDASSVKSGDSEVMKELYESCRRLRPVLYRMASETADDGADNSAIVDIFSSSDKLSRVMDSYEALPKPNTVEENTVNSSEPAAKDVSANLLDLTDFTTTAAKPTATSASSSGVSLLEDVFGSSTSVTSVLPSFSHTSSKDQSLLEPPRSKSAFSDDFANTLDGSIAPKATASNNCRLISPIKSASTLLLADSDRSSLSQKDSEVDLLMLDPVETTIEAQSMLPSKDLFSMTETINKDDMSDGQLIDLTGDKAANLSLTKSLFQTSKTNDQSLNLELSNLVLDDLFVPVQSIIPSAFPPVTIYDKNGLRVLLHFAKNRPAPYRTDILVGVVSILSTRTEAVRNILLQVAAPKVMKVKLQPPSCTELSPFNPIFSTPPLTQVMLIANPTLKAVTLRYKLDFKPDNQDSVMESGFIHGFPAPSLWGNL